MALSNLSRRAHALSAGRLDAYVFPGCEQAPDQRQQEGLSPQQKLLSVVLDPLSHGRGALLTSDRHAELPG